MKVRWVDEAGKKIVWPAEVPSVNITFNGTDPTKTFTLVRSLTKDSFVFGNVRVIDHDPWLTCPAPDGYLSSFVGSPSSGFVVTYKRDQELKTVKLVCGTKFSSKFIGSTDQSKITGIVFGKRSDWNGTINSSRSQGATVSGPFSVAVPYNAPYDSEDWKDDYVLYKVTKDGEMTVYVLSKDGRFVLNDSCEKMFINIKNLKSITGFTGPEDVNSIFSTELTTSMRCMFEGLESVQVFRLDGFVTSKVKNIYGMFKNCTGIRSIDISNWDTSGVTNMSYMFQNTQNPESDLTIDISSFDFNQREAVDMSYMFYQSGVNKIKFPKAESSNSAKNVTTIAYMFGSCSKLTEIENFVIAKGSEEELSNLSLVQYDFSGATNANNLFANCSSLENIGLSINLSSVTSITGMFTNCTGLRHLRLCVDLSSVTSIKQLIYNLPNLQSADLSKSNFAKLTSFDKFFNTLNALETIKMNDVVFSSFTGVSTTMFEDVYNLRHLEMQRADFSKVENTRFITRDSLYYLDLSGAKFSSKQSCEDMFKIISTEAGRVKQLQTIIMIDTELPVCTSYKNMFRNCHNLTRVEFKPKLPSVDSIDCTGMFANCEALTSINLDDWNKSKVTNISHIFENCTGLTGFDFDNFTLLACTDASYMFKGCTGISSLYMDGFTAPELRNCQGMFEGCTNLDIGAGNLAGWDLSEVTNLSCLFKGCTKMGSNSSGVISLSNMNFGSCETMSEAFSGCELLTTLKLNYVDLKACSSFTNFIAGCPIDTIEIMGSDLTAATSISFLKVAKNIDLSSSKFGLTSLSATFKDSEVEAVNLSNAEFDNCESFSELFKGCTKLTSLNVSGIKASNVKSCACMFESCTSLVLDAGILSNWDTSKVTNMSYIFKNCPLLGSDSSGIVSLSNLDLSSCTTMQQAFNGCTAMKELKMDSVDLKSCSTYTDFVANCNALTNVEITKSDLSAAPNLAFIKTIKNINLSNSKFGMSSLDSAFASQSTLLTMNLSGTVFTECTTFNKMFQSCSQLTSINMEGLVASKVTTCSYMFQSCTRLITIEAKDFKTVSCTDMKYMFDGCNNVTSVDLKGWTTGKVKTMDYMFNNFAIDVNGNRIHKVYITLDISDFNFNALQTCGRMINTEATGGYNDYIEKIILPSKAENAVAHNLTDVNRMFRKRVHLKSIDNLGLLSTSGNLTMAQSMFSECNMLEVIDISSMNLSNVTNTQYMFNFAQNQTPDRLKTIYVSSNPAFALTSKDTTHANMFTGRTILEGQNETKISVIKSYDKTYARIDGYNDLQGYFSVKQ